MLSTGSYPAWLRPDREHGGALRVLLGAPAVDGRANAALTDYLALCCEVPRRQVHLRSGMTSRRKRVEIDAPIDQVWLRLSAQLQARKRLRRFPSKTP
ncbi:hypothetical protein GALL_473280 [mine drainage metagenome]|uniref:Protein containing DUF167 n=1 Tax=mine drainage metagenome TaxID=410659 RepID=A0A1J5PTJ4_9ZZZZ